MIFDKIFKKKTIAYVTIITDEGSKKVKLGTFNSKEEAEEAIERIVKNFSIIESAPYEKVEGGYKFY